MFFPLPEITPFCFIRNFARMIFKTSITEYTGTVFKNLGYHVLNTDRVGRPRAVNGSGSQFFYTDTSSDRRRKPMPIYCNTTFASLLASIDSSLSGNVMILNTFLDNDYIARPLDVKYINYSQFIYAYSHRLNSDYSWVTFIEGYHINKVLVNNSLDELILLATPGGLPSEGDGYYDDGVSYFRLQVRSSILNLDQTMTPTGFGGSEGVDWDVIFQKVLP